MMDPVTSQQAARGARIAGRKLRSPYGSAGTRIFGGRMATLNIASATTFHVAAEVPTEFDGVQVILANTDTRFNWPAGAVAVAALPSAADLNGSAETWKAVTCGGPGMTRMGQANAAGGQRVSYTVSDVAAIKSVARSDGGTKPLLAIRAYFGTSAALPVVGNGTDDFTNWATRTDGHRWVMRDQAVAAASTGVYANFTSTTNKSQSPIAGFRFWARGRVVNVMNLGDSIDDGRGTYLGAGYSEGICDDLSGDLAFVQSNLGWSGQSSILFFPRALDALRDPNIRPDILILPASSPNDADPLTQAVFDMNAILRGRVIAECRRRGVIPILRTMLPVDTSVHDWGASDSYRRADNAAVLALRSHDVLVADTADAFETTLDGDGQMGVDPAMVSDGIHPNDTGYDAMIAAVRPLVAKAASIQ